MSRGLVAVLLVANLLGLVALEIEVGASRRRLQSAQIALARTEAAFVASRDACQEAIAACGARK